MTYNVFSGTLNPTHSLGTEVRLGPGHIVLDGGRILLVVTSTKYSKSKQRHVPIGPRKETQHAALPTFGACLLWPNGRPSQQLLSFCQTLTPSLEVASTTFWSYDRELWPMMSLQLDLGGIEANQRTRGHLVRRHTHTGPTAQPGPLKLSVNTGYSSVSWVRCPFLSCILTGRFNGYARSSHDNGSPACTLPCIGLTAFNPNVSRAATRDVWRQRIERRIVTFADCTQRRSSHECDWQAADRYDSEFDTGILKKFFPIFS